MKAVMWSKPGCPYCVMAEELLNKKGYEIEERKIGFGWNREQLFEAVPNVKLIHYTVLFLHKKRRSSRALIEGKLYMKETSVLLNAGL